MDFQLDQISAWPRNKLSCRPLCESFTWPAIKIESWLRRLTLSFRVDLLNFRRRFLRWRTLWILCLSAGVLAVVFIRKIIARGATFASDFIVAVGCSVDRCSLRHNCSVDVIFTFVCFSAFQLNFVFNLSLVWSFICENVNKGAEKFQTVHCVTATVFVFCPSRQFISLLFDE